MDPVIEAIWARAKIRCSKAQRKQFTCRAFHDKPAYIVELPDVSEDEDLTPELAASAARIAFGWTYGVWVFCEWDGYGYHLVPLGGHEKYTKREQEVE